MKLNDHPTVKKYQKTKKKYAPEVVDYKWLRKIAIDSGVDDVGFVEMDREELNEQKEEIQRAFPRTKSIISYVCRLNSPQIQSADRSLADVEFIALESEMKLVSRTIVKVLRENGIGSVVPSDNFPMDMLK